MFCAAPNHQTHGVWQWSLRLAGWQPCALPTAKLVEAMRLPRQLGGLGLQDRQPRNVLGAMIDAGIWLEAGDDHTYVTLPPPREAIGDAAVQLVARSAVQPIARSAVQPIARVADRRQSVAGDPLRPEPPPEEVLALDRLLERKRSQAFRARNGGPERISAHDSPRSKISVSVSEETKNQDLDLGAGDRFGARPVPTKSADQIRADVGPKLNRSVARIVADAIADGHVDAGEVDAVIARAHDLVAEGKCDAAPIYFVGAMKAIFAERRVKWGRSRDSPGGKAK